MPESVATIETTAATTATPPPETLLGAPVEAPVEEPKVEEPKAEAPVLLTAEALKFPEGFTVDEASRDSFIELMNKEMPAAERAQALIELQAKLAQEASEAGSREWQTVQDGWQAAVKADPDIGGANLSRTLSSIAKVIDEYGSPEAREAFNLTGAGNHPAIVKMMANVAKQLTEGRPVSGTLPSTQATLAEMMYPTMEKK